MTDTLNPDLDMLKRAVLLKRLQQTGGSKRVADAAPRIPLADRTGPLPLSWPQQRLWFLDRLDAAAGSAYHLFTALRLDGRLDERALQASLDGLLDRHESLRTTFDSVDGEPRQVIAPRGQRFALERSDLSGTGAAAGDAAVQALMDEEARRPFDLARGPLIRGRLVVLGPDAHVLLICQHHIVTDGWSMQVLTTEFVALYRAACAGDADPLPPLSLQYADYAAWQREQLAGPRLAAQLAYWREHLQGAPALLELPTDRTRPATQSFAGGSVSFTLPESLARSLRQLGQRHGATMYMTLLAGWSAFLHRLSGQSEVVVGTPVANRRTREVEGLIGYFANTLALRVRVAGDASVADLIGRVRQDTLAAFEHQDLPFEQVVEALNPPRSLSFSPVFQVLFTLSAWSQPAAIDLPALSLAPIATDRITAKADLSLSLGETASGEITGVMEYASDLFDASTIRRWSRHFQTLLASMAADESQAVDRLALLEAEDVRLLTQDFNAYRCDAPLDRTVHALFEAQVARTPDAIAVVAGDVRLSYAALNRRANQLAHHLIAHGLAPEERVAVGCERGVELLVALLGVLKAGGAYLPLDPALPRERQAFMVADSGARVLLAQSRLLARLPDVAQVVRLDADGWAEGLPEHDPALAMTSDRLAYVIYTSGSTGEPKGVMACHRNVVHLTVEQDFIDLSPRHRLAYCANPAFDASTWEIWGSLLNGVRLVIVPNDVLLEPVALAALLRREGVTVMQLIAGLLKRYAESLAEAISALDVLVFGGDQSELHTVMQIWRRTRPCRLLHGYGPTETTTFTTEYVVDEATARERTLPIGRPIANSRIYVLDAQGQPVPLGVQGEIHIGGAGVTRGYLNRDALTAERFVPDPFARAAGDEGARMYRTGDLGRYREDRNLEFLGRDDHQVKLRGYRIELGEIELRLARCEGVRQAFVMAREDAAGEKRLVAYLTGEPADAATLRAELARHLPEYMVPAAYVTLETLPVTDNGKVDRRALPEPDAAASATRAYAAPQGDVETALAETWQALLHVPAVGRDDHFFELGGHSLMVVAMVERLRHRGLLLEVRRVFDTPVLSQLAACVTPIDDPLATAVPANRLRPGTAALTPELLPLVALTQAQVDAIVRQVPGGAANVQDVYPLLPLQEGILFHHLLEPQGDLYLSRTVLAFDDRAGLDGFLASLQVVIDRHDVLRTSFLWEGLDAPVQVVRRQAALVVDDLATDRADGPALDRLLDRTDPRRTRLDLRDAPLLTACVTADDDGGWLLALRHHHIVTDHVSLDVILREIRHLATDDAATLPAPVPFREFVARGAATSPESHQRYFREQLGDVVEGCMPFGLVDTKADGGAPQETRRDIDAALGMRLRAVARRLGVPPSVLFHVAWARVVALATGRDDVVFGTVLSGRMEGGAGASHVVGMLINTLPMRLPAGDVEIGEVVAIAYRRLRELMAHEHASLAQVRQCCAVPPGMPLFTSVLNFRHGAPLVAGDGADGAWPGLRTVKLEERTGFPVTASIDDRDVAFSMTVQTVGVASERVAGYLSRAIEGVVAALESSASASVSAPVPMHALDLLPPSELERLRDLGRSDLRVDDGEALVHRLFEAQVRARPDAPALEFDGTRLSYAELDRRAERVARRLAAIGVRPDDRVALCVERGPELVIGLLAVLKAGGAWLPLDPAYPDSRLAWMLEDSVPVARLVAEATRERLPASASSPVIRLDADDEAADAMLDAGPARAALAPGLRPDHLAYVIYTSGSTGRPKGVMNRHDSLCNLARAQVALFGVGPGSRVLQFASASFDASVWEVVMALASGATLVMASREALRPGEPLAATMHAAAITHATLPSSAVAAMPAGTRFDGLCLVMAGEACPPALAAEWARHATVFNAYGPTETTVCATAFRCGTERLASVPIGRPLPHLRVHVLDAHRRLAPVGVAGEICIGGAGVARGYLNQPALTAERFVDDPFSSEPGARLYRTGDRGRWGADGQLEFLGRDDFQVKLRGFRVELGEVETALQQCAGVAEAVVVTRADESGATRLVAYVRVGAGEGHGEGDGAGAPSPVALRDDLAARLPEHMVPSAFVMLDRFPLTPNGKVDRHALPVPGSEAFASRPYEAPQGAIEEALAALWRDLLGAGRVGRHDDFFLLGGHSLLAVQLVSRLRQALDVEVPLNDLFEHRELGAFAARVALASASGPASDSARAPLPIADRAAPLPLSWAQERLWFFDQLDRAAGVMYHLPSALRLVGPLDRDVLRSTFDRIVERHENLRTSFVAGEDGAARLRIAPPAPFELPFHDLVALTPEMRTAEVARHREAEARTLFDLATGPLIRARLLRLAADEHLLLVTQHHIVSDAWSVGLMVREVNALYDALRRGLPDPLPPLPAQYADYASWQRSRLSPEVVDAQLGFWKSRLADAPTLLDLPLDHPRPAAQRFEAGTVPIALPPALTASLQALCRRHGCTLFMGLLAGWSVLLARLSGQASVVVGSGVANRQRVEVEPLIGLFVNTLCFHVQVEGGATVAALLAQVREHAVAGYAHQELPFDHLLEKLNPPRSLGHNAIFQAMFSMNETPMATDFDLGGLHVDVLEGEVGHTAVDLMLSLKQEGEALVGHLTYARALFEPATIARWAAHLECLLADMVADDQRALHRLSLVPAAERAALARRFDPAPRPRVPGLVHARFEARVAADPQAIAVVGARETLTYAELNRRANHLAHRLVHLGVRPGQRVAICTGRDLPMVVGVLAALKAGAAYVPLDPGYPEDRLAWMLDDSAPVALLTEAALEDLCPPHALRRTVLLDEALPDDASPDPVIPALTPDHAAYVIYTSGSTGRPKGVVVPHRALCHTIDGLVEAYDIDAASRVLQFVSFGFDVCVSELMMTLCSGARLCLVADEDRLGLALVRRLREHGITHVGIPVGALASLPPDADLGPLRALITGGDVLPVAVADHWSRRHPLFNSYGPTETTITATVHRCEPGRRGAVPIGRPLPGVEIRVLDADGQPVVPGVFGEIVIGGAGVSDGYLHQPGLTAERFVPDPFSTRPGALMYRSGDLGRWTSEGLLEFRGREDAQVKIRGFRIEPGEIESALAGCDGVAEAIVLAREAARGDRRLVAYLCARAGETPDTAAIRQRLLGLLPDYMVPAAWVTLDAFPLTAHGKVDRRALLEIDVDALAAATHEPPEGEVEIALARAWEDLLGRSPVGRRDDFFELGGHSLLAVQLVSRLRQTMGVEIALGELFAHPVLSAFAVRVAEARPAGLAPIPLADRAGPLPLSWSQQRLWFLDQLDPAAGAAYQMPVGLRLHGTLDHAALRATLDRLVARHEVLRSVYVQVDGQPVQRVAAPGAGFELQEHDLRHLRGHEQDFAVERLGLDRAAAAVDLARGPMIRGQLLRLADDEHVLWIQQHHIASDGWSIAILVREVSALYAAFHEGRPDPLPPLALQYADYAAWQRTWLQGEALKAQVDYWRERLAGAPALLDLPLDRPRPPVQDHAGAKVDFRLAPALVRGLESLAQRHGATLFMALLAGWSVVVSRLSGQRDVVIGTPVANRPRRELEDLIGFFVNTLALRISTEGDPSVADLLAQVRTHALAAWAHQDVPFEQVVEALQPQRSRSHSPVFQTMLTLDNTPGREDLVLPGLRLGRVEQRHSTTQFETQVSLSASEDGLAGTLSYAAALFDESTARRLVRYFEAVLRGMVEDEARPVDAIVLIDESERAMLTRTFNDTAAPRTRGTLVHELFEARVLDQPDAMAVVSPGRAYRYAELNRRANRLAHALVARGVRPGALVAVCLPRDADLVVALLAVLKAGGAYVPLDPNYPPDRLAYLLEDSAPKVLLTHRRLEDRLPGRSMPTLFVDLDRQLDIDLDPAGAGLTLEVRDEDPDPRGLRDTDLAYVLYTSGSTGQPKGVMIEHRNTVNLVRWACENFSPRELSRTLFATSINFDLHVFETMVPLACGACITVVEDVLGTPDGVTLVNTVPSAINALIDAGRLPRSVRTVNLAGEALTVATVERIFATGHVQDVANLYGPTETTTYSTWMRMSRDDGRPVVHIGRPIANTQVYLLDAGRQPVPVGVAGEIWIGGAGVARGYLRRPELTAERFVDDPFSDEPGARLYRTGDLGRWRADGQIEYLGRNDFQVKLRGFRIELGEVEARLLACEGVAEAAVLARQDGAGQMRLVAYVRGEEGVTLEPGALRDALGERLPDYMVPSAFMVLARFPLTPNGKVDRKALPAPDATALAQRPYEAPQGAVEEAVAAAWGELLGLDRVGRHDDFFALGGHSLLAVQLVSRLRQALGVDVALGDVFAQTEVAGFAARVARAGASRLAPIPRADRAAPLPLSWAQQRLWFLDQLDASASAAYHMPVALRLSGRLDRVALAATLDRLVARHESLRTTFASGEAGPMQFVAGPACGFPLVEQDLRELAGVAQEQEVDRVADLVFRRPFDLARGPLVRGHLLRLADDEHLLLINQHHIVSDAWSVGVLVKEVATLYAAFRRGDADPLPPLPIQYADFAAWQRGWLEGDALKAQVAYWQDRLADAPELLDLPLDRPRPAVQSYAGASVEFHWPAELSDRLKQLGQRHGATLFMTLLAAWGLLMSRLSGQDDVVVGTPVANRPRREVEGLIGYFLNTLALRVEVSGDATVADFLARTRRTVLEAYDHQDVPFEQVLDAVQPARSVSHNPLFQVMLTLNNVPVSGATELPDLVLSPIPQSHTATYCDLYLALQEGPQGLDGSLVYATDLFEHATVQRLVGTFRLLLEGLVADDRAAVMRLPIVDAAERELQFDTWNRSEAAFPLERTWIELFEARVREHPDRLAATDGVERLSYRELDDRASRLAAALVGEGAGPETLVTLMCERGVLMLTMMLAVFKAGAAFLPLDIKHPPARLLEIVETSGSPIVLLSAACEPQVREMARGRTLRLLVADGLVLEGDVPVIAPRGSPDDLAYVIFTSGSTGRPKGAMVEQRGMVNHMFGKIASLEIGAGDTLAQTASPAFDICVWQFLSALLVGGCTAILKDPVAYDPERLLAAVEAERITLLQTVPSMMRSLLDACHDGIHLATLRCLVPTGEALTTRLAQDWLARFPAIPLANMYGPAECSDDVTWQAIRTRPEDGSVIPIGRPTANNRIFILDRWMQPVPIGVKGEICVDGIGVGRGYLNDPVQTAKAFPPHPLGRAGRFYRTGDIGRYRADGVIEFHGRVDFQVKLRGFRIELAEIESRLARCEGVVEAVVQVREDSPGQKRLVAYLTGTPPEAVELRRVLGAQLPDYMVPTAFVTLPKLPCTPNGKLDRKALPAPDFSALAGRPHEAPEGEVEAALAEIWQSLLGAERVGRNDHFFELGGSSLVASQVVVRVRRRLGIELPLLQVFQTPVLRELAEALVLIELKRFDLGDVALASAELGELTEEELEAMLKQERELGGR